MVSTGYSTTMGMSGDMDKVTVGPKAVALVKRVRYRKAKFSSTGSSMFITTASSSLSTEVLCFNIMFPVPKSPFEVNRMPSLVTDMVPENMKK